MRPAFAQYVPVPVADGHLAPPFFILIELRVTALVKGRMNSTVTVQAQHGNTAPRPPAREQGVRCSIFLMLHNAYKTNF